MNYTVKYLPLLAKATYHKIPLEQAFFTIYIGEFRIYM